MVRSLLWPLGVPVDVAVIDRDSNSFLNSSARAECGRYLRGVARSTALKAREFGIRLALGAHPPTLVRRVVVQGLRPDAIGGLIGLAGGWWAVRLLQATPVFGSLLFQISAHDPWTFVLVLAGVLTVALAAAWLPARRVSRVDPTVVLRDN